MSEAQKETMETPTFEITDNPVVKQITGEKTDWTIMVYLGGDNNLAEEMVYALKCMFNAGSTKQYQVYALFDAGLQPVAFKIPMRREEPDSRPDGTLAIQELDSTMKRKRGLEGPLSENIGLFMLAANRKPRPKVESVQTTLEKFIKSAVADSPAYYYALILSGHGSGSVGDFLAARKRFDGLTIPDLSETLSNVGKYFRENRECFGARDKAFKISVLGMDSCQMSTAEVACEVREHVNFLVGAEGYEPNTGWPYDLMLARLDQEIQKRKIFTEAEEFIKDGKRDEAQDLIEKSFVKHCVAEMMDLLKEKKFEFPEAQQAFAEGAVKEYVKFYSSDYALAEVSTDLSAVNLGKFSELADFLRKKDGLVDLLIRALEKKDGQLPQEGNAILLAHWESQGYKDEQNVDLLDFCTNLRSRCEQLRSNLGDRIGATCGQVIDAIKRFVICSGYCGPAFQHSHGLSVYFPWCSSTDAAGIPTLDQYSWLEFALETRWDEFLEKYTVATRRSFRETKGTEYESSLNRQDFLFTSDPEDSILGDHELTFDLSYPPDEELANSFTDGDLAIADITIEAAEGELGTSEFSDGELLVRDGKLSVRDGKLSVRDGKLSVRSGMQIEIRNDQQESGGGKLLVRDGKLSVRDGKLSVRDGKLSVRDGKLSVRDGKLSVRDGKLSVRDASMFSVRDGKLSVRDGKLSVRDGKLSVRDGKLSVRDGDLVTAEGSAGIPVRDGKLSVRDGKLSVRDGLMFRNSSLSVPDGLEVRDGTPFGRGGLGLPTKIATMKNPPISWKDCDLIANSQEAEPTKDKAMQKPAG